MWRHAMSGVGPGPDFDPHAFLMAHLETILRGLARPATKKTKEPHENQ